MTGLFILGACSVFFACGWAIGKGRERQRHTSSWWEGRYKDRLAKKDGRIRSLDALAKMYQRERDEAWSALRQVQERRGA